MKQIRESFGRLHEQNYGYRSDGEKLQFVALKVLGSGLLEGARVPEQVVRPPRAYAARPASRRAYYGREHGWLDSPLLARSDLAGRSVTGPCIIEEYDATAVVRPGWTAQLDEWNNIILTHNDQ